MTRKPVAIVLILATLLPPTILGKECDSRSLPPSASHLLERRFPSWRIVTIGDLTPDDQRVWSKNYDGACPGLTEGNFGSAGSYAVSLIHQHDGKLLQTVILLERSHSAYQYRVLSRAGETALPMVLLKFPPGRFSDAEHTRTVRTDYDSVAFMELEGAGVLFYRAAQGFKSIEIAE